MSSAYADKLRTLTWVMYADVAEVNLRTLMWVSFRKSQELQATEPIRIRNSEIERVKVFKLLRVHVQSDLKCIAHIDEIVARASKRLYFLRVCRKANLPTEVGTLKCFFSCRFAHTIDRHGQDLH